MGDLDNKKGISPGCLIAVVVIVILNLVFFFKDTSSNDIAGLGATLLCFAGMFVGYYIIKQFSSFLFSPLFEKFIEPAIIYLSSIIIVLECILPAKVSVFN